MPPRPKQARTLTHCRRCAGCLCLDRWHDPCGWFDLSRCLNCGAVYDTLILLNQAEAVPTSVRGPNRRVNAITPEDFEDHAGE